MTAKLAAAVAVDIDATTVTLSAAGRLAPNNVLALLSVVGRAGRVLPGFAVHLDLDLMDTESPEAVRTLTESGASSSSPISTGRPVAVPPSGLHSEAGSVIDEGMPGRRDRVFHTFQRWPLVPTDDLVKLRQSLRQVQGLGVPTAAGELPVPVDCELHRRAHTPQGDRASGTGPGPD